MSAPQTNIEKQKRRHVAPLVGMAVVVVFAVGLLIWWIGYESAEAPGPTEQPAATAGAPEPAPPSAQPTEAEPAPANTATGQQEQPGTSN